ncbi:MAG: ammonium transporter, partial [Pedobacter sp.]
VVGLVAITPAAGFVAIPQSITIGVIAAIISNIAVHYKQKSSLDDTLDVFPCHGIGGIVGMLLTGVFATKAVNAGGADGLWLGNAEFLWVQFKGMIIAVTFSFVMSYIIFKFINFIQPIRVSSEEEELGLDATQHNEKYLQGHLIVNANGTSLVKETEIEKGTVYTS